jgi:hypothetical protein
MCGLWLRHYDPFTLPVIADFVKMQARGVVRGVRARQSFDVRGHLLSLRGLAGGLAYGVRQQARSVQQLTLSPEQESRE